MHFLRSRPRRPRRGLTSLTALALIATAGAAVTARAAGTPAPAPQPATPAATAAAGLATKPVCGDAAPGSAACLSVIDTNVNWNGRAWIAGPAPATRPHAAPPVRAAASSTGLGVPVPQPFMAAELQDAYRLPSSLLGARQVVAIVDAFDAPSAAADLAVYRAANHLPACDAAFPCFKKVNQRGEQGNYPTPDVGWATEASLDLDMASADCPSCQLLLVEADDNTLVNLAAAVDEAAKLGATVISNSYGAFEGPAEKGLAASYNHPGVAVVASSGDLAYVPNGAMVPAAYGTVTAVGGTTLWRSATPRGWSEAVWQYAGSGCSAYIAKPAWQHDQLCDTRTMADVAAIAAPETPVAVYDTFGWPGWLAAGGTSVGAPLIAGVYALAGNTADIGPGASWAYAHRHDLNDVSADPALANVTPPANGVCGGTYLCTTGVGYDGPTGLGTPNGIGAF